MQLAWWGRGICEPREEEREEPSTDGAPPIGSGEIARDGGDVLFEPPVLLGDRRLVPREELRVCPERSDFPVAEILEDPAQNRARTSPARAGRPSLPRKSVLRG
jgi:hypothetical protein